MSIRNLIREIQDETMYMYCYDCCSCHRMDYCGRQFQCEECYRRLDIEDVDTDDILYDDDKLRQYILTRNAPKRYIIAWLTHLYGQNTLYDNKNFIHFLYQYYTNGLHFSDAFRLANTHFN